MGNDLSFVRRTHRLTASIQTFCIPGSMYLCILAGAMWGVPVALPIVCICIGIGASFCFLLSKQIGACIQVVPRWQQRIDSWKDTVQQYESSLFSYLTILRMMPVPPHFLVNIISPHLGIPMGIFFMSTVCGVFCSSLIYTAIGEGIEQITSYDSLRIFTWRNVTLITIVALACALPAWVKGRVQTPEDNPVQLSSIRLPTNTGQTTDVSWSGRIHNLYQSLLALVHPALRASSEESQDHDERDETGRRDFADESLLAWQEQAFVPGLRTMSSAPPINQDHHFSIGRFYDNQNI